MAKIRKKSPRKDKLKSLLSAAMAIPGLGVAADAQTLPDAPIIRIRYSDYQDYQSGKERRMRVLAPMASLQMPLGEGNTLDAGFTYDSTSGASPFYVDTLSSASIRDQRRAGNLKFTHNFENFSLAGGGRVSSEDDFLSRGGLLESKIWTPDKNTTFTLGFSYDKDDLASSMNEEFGARRRTQGYLFGITQVINANSIYQANINYGHSEGYQSDPYKSLDNRPHNRDTWSLMNRYNLYFPEYEASLHADYRFFIDSWGIKSHMLEVAWYQPFGGAWMVRPSVRYYTQCAAQFYDSNFPPENFDQQYSADQRMGNFGSIGGGLKLIRELGRGFSADISFESFLQKPGYALGSDQDNDVKDFYATFFSIGVAKKF